MKIIVLGAGVVGVAGAWYLARAGWAQWRWGLRFLRECMPGRFERHSRTLAALAHYSLECLRALRAELALRYMNTGHGTLGWTLACGSAALIADVISGRCPAVAFPIT